MEKALFDDGEYQIIKPFVNCKNFIMLVQMIEDMFDFELYDAGRIDGVCFRTSYKCDVLRDYINEGGNYAERQMKKLGWELTLGRSIDVTDGGTFDEFVKLVPLY